MTNEENPIVCVYADYVTTHFKAQARDPRARAVYRALNLANGWDPEKVDEPTPAAKEASYRLHRTQSRKVLVFVRQDGRHEIRLLEKSEITSLPINSAIPFPIGPQKLTKNDFSLRLADLHWALERCFDLDSLDLEPGLGGMWGTLLLKKGRWIVDIDGNFDRLRMRFVQIADVAGDEYKDVAKTLADGEVMRQALEFATLFLGNITFVAESTTEEDPLESNAVRATENAYAEMKMAEAEENP